MRYPWYLTTRERTCVHPVNFDSHAILDFEYVPPRVREPLRTRVHLEMADLKLATKVVVQHHYLHRGRTMAQLAFWIVMDRHRVGVMLFALPRLSVSFCGYPPMSLLELARLWLVPHVQNQVTVDSRGKQHASCVATCAVGQALRRCRKDWQTKYPHLPPILAVISWADMRRHDGTIYRAANFVEVGLSGGSLHGNTRRPTGGRDQLHSDYLHRKRAFLYKFGPALARV